jgi:hypothetical protein
VIIKMNTFKERILRVLQQRSDNRAAMLSRQYLTAEPHEREAIIAGIEFEKWLSKVCDDCMD